MSQKETTYLLSQVATMLGLSIPDLKGIVVEFRDLIKPRPGIGQDLIPEDGIRYIRAAQRWRARGMSWEDIRTRFSHEAASDLDPYPREIEWAREEGAAAADADETAVEVREVSFDPGPEQDLVDLIGKLRRDLQRADVRRRDDWDRMTVTLSRIEKEMELLRYELACMTSRRNRRKSR